MLYAVWLFELKPLPFYCFTGATKTWFYKERSCLTLKDKNWETALPLYSYQFPRLVTSPHQHAAVCAIPQLLQGSVAIHYPSRCFHPLVHLMLSWNTLWADSNVSLTGHILLFPVFCLWLASMDQRSLIKQYTMTLNNCWSLAIMFLCRSAPGNQHPSEFARFDPLQWQERNRI